MSLAPTNGASVWLVEKNLCEEKNFQPTYESGLKCKQCVKERENIECVVKISVFYVLFKVRIYSPDVQSFRLCSTLNPDCSICMN